MGVWWRRPWDLQTFFFCILFSSHAWGDEIWFGFSGRSADGWGKNNGFCNMPPLRSLLSCANLLLFRLTFLVTSSFRESLWVVLGWQFLLVFKPMICCLRILYNFVHLFFSSAPMCFCLIFFFFIYMLYGFNQLCSMCEFPSFSENLSMYLHRFGFLAFSIVKGWCISLQFVVCAFHFLW